MLVVFVHGWGVRKPAYGTLPDQLRQALGPDTIEVWLSEYISYSDEVTMNDLADAFERARLRNFRYRKFSCVTHSTGGPVIRTWMDRYNGPLTGLVMLAPPNHGSALAQLGKSRLSRLKYWWDGVEPGQKILDWLELGSEESWALNRRWINSNWNGRMLVLSGSQPDESLYDHLNSYTGERASDGVVRLPAANLNYSLMQLRQVKDALVLFEDHTGPNTPFYQLSGTAHGSILNLDCSPRELVDPTSMVIFKVIDSSGEPVNDYDLLLTTGPNNSPDALPRGFCIDRQRNSIARNTITYFLNYAVMANLPDLGFLVDARPNTGPVHYTSARFRSAMFLRPNETTMIEITLNRRIEARLFRRYSGSRA